MSMSIFAALCMYAYIRGADMFVPVPRGYLLSLPTGCIWEYGAAAVLPPLDLAASNINILILLSKLISIFRDDKMGVNEIELIFSILLK